MITQVVVLLCALSSCLAINRIITVAGGNSNSVSLTPLVSVAANGTAIGSPQGVAMDEHNNMLYFSGTNSAMFAYNATNGSLVLLNTLSNMGEQCAYDTVKKIFYATNPGNGRVYATNSTSGAYSIAVNKNGTSGPPYNDDGPATDAHLDFANGIAIDKRNNLMFIAGTILLQSLTI
jgi:sugar lactone lactonase YvrE